MRKQGFTAAQRWAVWIVHGEKCYLDGHPIDLQSMQVDHIIPESLAEEPERLAQVLHDFGLPPGFDLNSYENWMPACGTHNNQKRAKVFNPTPLIQMYLARAAEKAGKAREVEHQSISRVAFAKATNVVMREAEALGISTEEFVAFLDQLIQARVKEKGISYLPAPPPTERSQNTNWATWVAILVGSGTLGALGGGMFAEGVGQFLFRQEMLVILLPLLGWVFLRDWSGKRDGQRDDSAGVIVIASDETTRAEQFRAALSERYKVDDIKLTPTTSISFEKAFELVYS